MADEAIAPTPAATPAQKAPVIKEGMSADTALKLGRKFSKLVGDLDAANKRNMELQGQLSKAPKAEDFAKLQRDVTERKHLDVFKAEGRKAGIPENRLDAAWRLAGHNAEGEPDAKAIKSLVDSTIEANDFLKPAAAEGTETETEADPNPVATTPEPKLGKGVGANKGGHDREVGGFTATQAQVMSPSWMAANQAKIAEHSKAGTFKILG